MTSDELKARFRYMFAGPNIGLDLYERWTPILAQACAEIDAILGQHKQGFHFSQIKEKYGSARYYFEAAMVEGEALNRIEASLDQAERATATVCMLCGSLPLLKTMEGGYCACAKSTHMNVVSRSTSASALQTIDVY